MKSRKTKNPKANTSFYEDLEEKKGNHPNAAKRNKTARIQEELADDFGEVLGDGFHGMDDDYYFDEDDMY